MADLAAHPLKTFLEHGIRASINTDDPGVQGVDIIHEMWAVMNRLIELTGWIVLVVSVILLGVASHIDNYQPPEQSTTVQHK